MKASELRIGNWVLDIFNKANPVETQIDLDDFQVLNNFRRSNHPASGTGDFSGLAILISNGFTIALALYQDWDLRPLLIIYWAQSVIIGVFNFFRMIRLKNFTTEGLTSNGQPVPETSKGKWNTAIFFAAHYGFFHFVYAVFVSGIAFGGQDNSEMGGPWEPDKLDFIWIALAVLGFLVGHWFSFRKNVEADLKGRPNLGTMMFLPYARIIPMHLTLILGFAIGSNRGALFLFLVLKTGADWLMHVVEHRVLQKNAQN